MESKLVIEIKYMEGDVAMGRSEFLVFDADTLDTRQAPEQIEYEFRNSLREIIWEVYNFKRYRCETCGLPFTYQEYQECHWLHEPDCSRSHYHEWEEDEGDDELDPCDCDLVAHDRCCPVCYPEAAAAIRAEREDKSWI